MNVNLNRENGRIGHVMFDGFHHFQCLECDGFEGSQANVRTSGRLGKSTNDAAGRWIPLRSVKTSEAGN